MRGTARSMRRVAAATTALAAAALLAACGSDSGPSDVPGPNYATVTGAGRSLDFPATVDRSDYPNACRLMPTSSMQALIGAPVTSGRTTAGCAWSAGEASLPTIALQFVEIGSDASSVYGQRRPEGASVRGVDDLGSQARVYRVNDNMTTRVDVLEPRVFFRVEVRITTTAPQDLANAEQVGVRMAQLIAEQVK